MRNLTPLAIILLLVPYAAAQDPVSELQNSVYEFSIEIEETSVSVEAGGQAKIPFTLHDTSRDSSSGALGFPGGEVTPHKTTFKIEYDGVQPKGWHVLKPAAKRTFGGESVDLQVTVSAHRTLVEDPQVRFSLNATHHLPTGEKLYTVVKFSAVTLGQNVYNARFGGGIELAPKEYQTVQISLYNGALVPREFTMEMGDNSCGISVAYSNTILVDGKDTKLVGVDLRGPDDKFRYSSELCFLTLVVYPTDEPANARNIGINPQITGLQVDPVWIFNTVGVLLAGLVIFAIVARRKARIEEEILGRPQKPWLIPVEQVYLRHLKERDPQAHYVVRHYLMEEEYQSSLMWYSHYKRATRGSRAKERLVVGQEHKYAKFEERWARKIAAPTRKAERVPIKLQKKLDRQGKSGLRKQKRKWRKLTKKMKAAHKKKVARATEKWEKQKAKAEKKNKPVPEKPALAEPNYPPEPTGDRLLLAHHKWQKKVVKARTKATKKVGNLEVKFEKKSAKLLGKVRRKVQKIARKLDDPEFAAEHPLLAEASA